MTEHPHLETPGGRIRSARETRGISLAEMSELTKIPPPVLTAIEADEYHKVSGALYIKSFLRSCATELGLDADEILDLYGRFSGETRATSGGPNPVWEEEEVQISHVGWPWRGIALTGVALVLVGVGLLSLTRSCDRTREAAPDDAGTVVSTSGPIAAPDTAGAGDMTGNVATARNLAGSDTLAGAWVSQAPLEEPSGIDAAVVASLPAVTVPAPVVDPVVANDLPLPLVGGPNLVFAGGGTRSVVVRIICGTRLELEVKRDAEQAYSRAVWPADETEVPPLPPTGIVAGRVYAVSRGMVMYWGADDHISLRLDQTEGVELTLNGKPRDIHNLRPGVELLLDLAGN